MKLSISIHYKTSTDQAPLLNIVNNDKEITIPMNSMPCDLWRAETEIETTPNHQLDYYYSVGDRQESQINSITLEPQYEWYVIEDHWHDPLEYPSLSSSPFVNIFNKAKKKNQKGNLCFEIKYPTPTSPEQKIVMVGNCPELGDWNPKKAPQFQQIGSERWQLKIPYQELPSTIEYKYVILSPQTTQWEEGENRKRELNGASPQTYYIYSREAAPRIKPSPWQGAGVAIPLFSLRSENSAGIGDFADLEKFAQWTASIGAKVVQILPINDTTQTHTHQDSYPYSAISVYALHPLYLSLDRMGILQDATLAHQIADRAQQLNNLELLDYDKVDTLKWEFFRALYRQDGARTLESKEYQRFYNQNQKWLKPYALFSFLRDINGTADYSQWGEWKEYDPQKADRLVSPQGGEYQEIAIYLYLQYHLDKQLREVRQACAQMGVALKGDIPIGVNRHSVESWIEPHLFNLNAQAGAPPDAFSSQGQNWGLPT
ncbi:MAG: 4-alpha-glucanotransferase, partial [Rikenellaceae bacterium]